MGRTVLEFLGLHGSDRTGEVDLLLCTVTDHDGLVQQHRVLLEDYLDPAGACGHENLLDFIAHAVDLESHVSCRDTECETAIGTGHRSVCGGSHDGCSNDWLLLGVKNCSRHLPGLCRQRE